MKGTWTLPSARSYPGLLLRMASSTFLPLRAWASQTSPFCLRSSWQSLGDMPQRNVAVELLQKLLRGEVNLRRRTNVVQARSFAEMLEQTLRRYQNRAIEAAQVIEELLQLAREMREAGARGEKLGLTDDELAFYDALETNDSAVQVLGDETFASYCTGTGSNGQGQRHHRLDSSRKRQGSAPCPCPAHSPQVRVSAR